jgi:hypothetical protein
MLNKKNIGRAFLPWDACLAGLVDIHLPFHWLVLCGVLGTR